MKISLRIILTIFLCVASIRSSENVKVVNYDLIDFLPDDILIKTLADYFPPWKLKPFRLISKRFRNIVDVVEARIIESVIRRPKFTSLKFSVDSLNRPAMRKELLRISHSLRNQPELIEDLGILIQFLLKFPPKIPNLVYHVLELMNKLPEDQFQKIELYELIDESIFTLRKYVKKGKRGVFRRCMNLVKSRRLAYLGRDYVSRFHSNVPKARDPARLASLISESIELDDFLQKPTTYWTTFLFVSSLYPVLFLEMKILPWWRQDQMMMILPLIGGIIYLETMMFEYLSIYVADYVITRE